MTAPHLSPEKGIPAARVARAVRTLVPFVKQGATWVAVRNLLRDFIPDANDRVAVLCALFPKAPK